LEKIQLQKLKTTNIQQALQLATTNAELSILPTFSNDVKTSATELQKVLSDKQGGGWTNRQTITHFKNALRGEVLKWYNALPLFDTDNLNWDAAKTQFCWDYRQPPQSLQ
jgi:hypothetical protein